jgi:hypothetical protein
MSQRFHVRITGDHEVAVSWPGCETEPEYRDDEVTAEVLARRLRQEIREHLSKPGATMGNRQW